MNALLPDSTNVLKKDQLQILLPWTSSAPFNKAEILGAITWLWFNSTPHADWSVLMLNINASPAIEHRQFLMMRDAKGLPLLYFSWANLDERRERQYLKNPRSLRPDEWNCGDRKWIVDWVAPFGGSARIVSMLRHRIFTKDMVCTIRVKPNSTTGRLRYYFGDLVPLEQRRKLIDRLKNTVQTV